MLIIQSKSIEDRVLLSINQVVKQYQNNPYILLRENDIQCVLFTELRKNISETIKIPSKIPERKEYEISLVNSEYSENKIDLVCLNKGKIESGFYVNDPFKGHDTYIYNLPIDVGIELKCITMGYKKDISISQKDYNKLDDLKEIDNKLAICFIQTKTQADTFLANAKTTHTANQVNKITELDGIFIITPTEVWKAKPI
ncbi:MAG: hypothetical protein OEY59_10475 [Deltaproteobacteria bacterium]|nr:hypothetical protein [Deltaproteobacteria bacterium]